MLWYKRLSKQDLSEKSDCLLIFAEDLDIKSARN